MSQIEEPFVALLDNLMDGESPLRAAMIYRLSDPSAEDIALFKARWPDIPAERKETLLARIEESSETNFELDFSQVALFTLQDEDPQIRVHSINALWTSEEPEVMYALLGLLKNDDSADVRSAAAEGLGQYVLLGELGHLPSSISGDAERALLESFREATPNSDVYRRSIESLAYSSHHEITDLIADVAKAKQVGLRASAMLAMGRNGDSRWYPRVLEALTDPEPEVRIEAVRAAGEMSLTDSVDALIALANDYEDREIQETAIWSLGEIGGDDAQNALFKLSESTKNDGLLEAIEDATNLATLSLGDFGMYVMAPEDDDDDLLLEDLEGLDADDTETDVN